MANNRMWIVCRECCKEDPEDESNRCMVAKFYGTVYEVFDADPKATRIQKLDAFFEDHAGCSILDENCFQMEYEHEPGQ